MHRRKQYPRKGLQDQRLTTCKVCFTGIFRHQQYVWAGGQHPGLIHADCPHPIKKEPNVVA